MRARYGITFVQYVLSKRCRTTLILAFTRDEQRAKCGGSCWRSVSTCFDRQLLHKTNTYYGINGRIDLITNEFHRCWFEIVSRWFWAKNAARWWGMIQGTMFRWIRTWHMSSHELKGPPEQETELGQQACTWNWHVGLGSSPSGQDGGGWPLGLAGRPPWSADYLVGPTASNCHMELPHWFQKAV